MAVTISAASPADAAAIATLLRICWSGTYGSFLSEATLATIAREWHHPDILTRQIANPKVAFLLARAESGTLVGAATVKLAANGIVLSLQRLYVHPSFQHQGIGSRLLRDALAAFPHARRIQLEVAEANPQGRGFWTTNGFQESGRTQARIGDVTMELVTMEKAVSG